MRVWQLHQLVLVGVVISVAIQFTDVNRTHQVGNGAYLQTRDSTGVRNGSGEAQLKPLVQAQVTYSRRVLLYILSKTDDSSFELHISVRLRTL